MNREIQRMIALTKQQVRRTGRPGVWHHTASWKTAESARATLDFSRASYSGHQRTWLAVQLELWARVRVSVVRAP